VDPLPLGSIQHTDIGATDPRWKCERVSDLITLAKAGYWAWKTAEWLAEVP
jgi:hypothetical protein